MAVGLYLGVEPSAGGMFQYAQCILRSLADMRQRGELAVVVAYGDERWVPLLDRFQLPCVRLRRWRQGTFIARVLMAMLLPLSTTRFLSRIMNPLDSELRNLNCGLWFFPAQDELTWQIDVPVMGTIHDLMHRYEQGFPEAGNWWRKRLREHRFRSIAWGSLAIIVDSELGKQQVIESYGVQKELVYALPYIAPDHVRQTHERNDFDAFYQLPKKYYFYPAQFWKHKNHMRLVDALAEARKVFPDMVLIFSGGKNHEYDKINRHVSELRLEDAVRFVGYVPDEDIGGFYSRARGLVMPTFFGPTNIPPLEAMASGCPVLISKTYGMPEQCGSAALYFDPNSVTEIRDRMIKLWTDDQLYRQLSVHGLMRTKAWGHQQFEQRLAEIIAVPLKRISDNQHQAVADYRV